MAEVLMPKMSDGMEEGTLLRWLKKEGETVAKGESIAEIETDKANVEMPAEDAGTLSKIVVSEGETVAVGAIIAHIGEVTATKTSTNGVQTAPKAEAAPVSAEPATVHAENALPPESASAGNAADTERVKASPLARKMAQDKGIDLAQVRGTGGGVGRIVQRDIQAFLEKVGTAPRPVPIVQTTKPTPAPLAASAAPTLVGEDVDISRMRKAIARRTVQSKQMIPHFYLVIPVEMDAAISLLAQMNEGAAKEAKITVNDLIVKACAVALTKFPDVNVSYTPDEKIRRYPTINIGVAVGTDDGLTIPVVSDCGGKSLRQISADAKALIGKARTGTLTPQEMSGGTFSVSNLGMFGVEEFAAIINPPESAILAVGGIQKEVAVDDAGNFVVRQRMRVTLSCDHRTVDGLLGAKFLQEVQRLLETPFSLLS